MIQDNDEELEEQQRIVDATGMIDYMHFLTFRKNCALGMINYGDQFIKFLGMALEMADDKDAIKIIRVWQNDCTICEMTQRAAMAKHKALEELKATE